VGEFITRSIFELANSQNSGCSDLAFVWINTQIRSGGGVECGQICQISADWCTDRSKITTKLSENDTIGIEW